jgi:hypothetical protein
MSETCAKCGRAAVGAVMVKVGLARQWKPWWTCELDHRAREMAGATRKAHPDAMVLAFANLNDIAPCLRRAGRR